MKLIVVSVDSQRNLVANELVTCPVPEMFEKPTAVMVSSTDKIDKAFQDVLKDSTLIVVLPQPQSKPAAAK